MNQNGFAALSYAKTAGKRMPRYFLDVSQSQSSAPDEVGTVLPNEEAGRCLALSTLATIATRSIEGNDQQSWFASIRDTHGNTLYRAKLTLSGRWEDEGR
jgi:hypothetical protein